MVSAWRPELEPDPIQGPKHYIYRWVLRCPPFDTELVRRMRILALARHTSESELLNWALQAFLDRERETVDDYGDDYEPSSSPLELADLEVVETEDGPVLRDRL